MTADGDRRAVPESEPPAVTRILRGLPADQAEMYRARLRQAEAAEAAQEAARRREWEADFAARRQREASPEAAAEASAWMSALLASQEREIDRLCAGLIVLNRLDRRGPGTTAEHVAALRALVAELASFTDGRLFIHQRALCEIDLELDPPAVRITKPAQLREVLDRLMGEAYRDDPDDWPLWRFIPGFITLERASVADISDQAVQQALAMPRWKGVPALQVRAELESLAEDAPPSVVELIMTAIEPGESWTGSMTELARLVGWAGTAHALSNELHDAMPALAARGSGRPRPAGGLGAAGPWSGG
jgi:hypothetical protein